MGRRCPISKYKRLIITVAIGEGIRPFFETVSKPRFEAYAEKCGADFKALTTGGLDVNGNEVMQPWWGLEKMRVGLPAHTDGYDQILFVDADIIIQDFAPNIFDGHQMGKVGIQNDWDVLKSDNHAWAQPEFDLLMREQGRETYKVSRMLNTGVVLFDKYTTGIWVPPPKPFTMNHCAEQFWVDYQIGDDWYDLDRKWNIQHWQGHIFESGWRDSYFIHLSGMSRPDENGVMCRMRWYWNNILGLEPPGTQFELLAIDLGYKACSICKRTLVKMNEMGPKWCKENKSALVNQISLNVINKTGKDVTPIDKFGISKLLNIAIARSQGKNTGGLTVAAAKAYCNLTKSKDT